MAGTLTMKFGGTSVGDAAAIRRTAGIVRQVLAGQAEQAAVVVSAMRGVTDALLGGAQAAAQGDPERARHLAEDLGRRHGQAASALLEEEDLECLIPTLDNLLDGYVRLCESIAVLGEATPRALDHVAGLGERMNARLVAAAFRRQGLPAEAVDATDLIVTDARFQNATPDLEATRRRVEAHLRPLLEGGGLPVVTGFIGATSQGVPTTLGRGGSDYSAAILGACLDCDEVWIWTDVDGVMSADPRLVPGARSLRTLSYLEVSELAYFGARVLHPKTIRPVLERGIPIRVKNTFNPDHPGTLILPDDADHPTADRRPLKAVTAIPDISLITIEGKGMLGVPGIAARAFGAVARTGTNVLLISQASSEQSICFAVQQSQAPRVVAALEAEFERELARRDIDRVWSRDGVTIVTAVGAGMRSTPGVAGRVFSATGARGVNVLAIAQGSSECSLSLVVDGAEGEEAVRAIHALTLEAEPGEAEFETGFQNS